MKIEISKGMNIHSAVGYVKDLVRKEKVGYGTFEFNGIELTVFEDSNVYDSVHIYNLEHELRRLKR